MPTRPHNNDDDETLYDKLVRQRQWALDVLAPMPLVQEDAAEKERRHAADEQAQRQDRGGQRRAESASAALFRHLPADLRQVAAVALGRLSASVARVRAADQINMAAWRKMQRQQIAGLREVLSRSRQHVLAAQAPARDLIGYITRTRPSDAVAPEPATRPDHRPQLFAWRANPAAMKEFLIASSNIATGSVPLVDLARQVQSRRCDIAARDGIRRAVQSRRVNKRAACQRTAERMVRAINLQNEARPVTKTKKGQAQPKSLAKFHDVARSRALIREFRCWTKAHGSRDAHQFSRVPLAIAFEGSAGQATIIGAAHVDLSSPTSIRHSLGDIGNWASHKGRKPFHRVRHVEQLIVTLPPEFAGRADVPQQLLYRAYRDAARLGFDLTRHAHLIVQHHDTEHPHCHVLISRIRDDAAVVQVPSEHAWRALGISRDVMTRDFQRNNFLNDDELFEAIGGWDSASRHASLALERGDAQGAIVHLDGHRESYEMYGQRAANREMRCAGFQEHEDQLPGGLSKLVAQNSDITSEMQEYEDIVLYVLRMAGAKR